MSLKFINKKIITLLLCGVTCFTLSFLLTKGISEDEGKSLEVTSKSKKLLSDLAEIDLEIVSFKKQILGAKEVVSKLKSSKENLQRSLGMEIEETSEPSADEDLDLDLSLAEDDEDTSYHYYYEQEYYYPTYTPSGNPSSTTTSTNNLTGNNNNSNNNNAPIIESNPQTPVIPPATVPEENNADNEQLEPGSGSDNNENIDSTPPSVDEDTTIPNSPSDNDEDLSDSPTTLEN